MNFNELLERSITRKAQEKADELGVKFKVKHSTREGVAEFLVRIKREMPKTAEVLSEIEIDAYQKVIDKQNQFVDFISHIIVPDYSNGVRFTYPSKL